MADKWLQLVINDPSMIPCQSNIWLELEKKFTEAFSNYAEHKRAQDELKKLKMKGNNLDKYLATFETLGQHSELDPNDSSNLQTFALGLPQSLANACIKMENPESYEQWRAAVQGQQKIYLKTKALHLEYSTLSSNRTKDKNKGRPLDGSGTVPEATTQVPTTRTGADQEIPHNLPDYVSPPEMIMPWIYLPLSVKLQTTKNARSIARQADALNAESKATLSTIAPIKRHVLVQLALSKSKMTTSQSSLTPLPQLCLSLCE